MTVEDAIEVLREMQLWRRGEGRYDVDGPCEMPYSPKEFGEAIDVAIGRMEEKSVWLVWSYHSDASSPWDVAGVYSSDALAMEAGKRLDENEDVDLWSVDRYELDK